MISEEQERFRESWFASIPQQYRYRPKAKFRTYDATAGIIAPPPPKTVLAAWFALTRFRTHVTQAQKDAALVCRGKPRHKRKAIQLDGSIPTSGEHLANK